MADADENAKARRRSNLWAIGIAVALIAGLAMCMPSSSEPTAEDLERADQTAPVTADNLLAAYRENEVAAGLRFDGKPLRVTGTIASIGRSPRDEPYLDLADGIPAVLLLFKPEAAPDIAKVKAGDTVTALCTELAEIEGDLRLDGCFLR